jgi:hypothetical protein
MPNGCGTLLQKIRVFENRIELGSPPEENAVYCPTAGLDEKFFAA